MSAEVAPTRRAGKAQTIEVGLPGLPAVFPVPPRWGAPDEERDGLKPAHLG